MLKAILVDDELLSVHMMKNLIEWERYGVCIVDTASDGCEALEKFRAHRPDIIVTDIKMPHLNGIEFFRHVREMSADTEVIFVSAYADFALVKEAIALGGSNYLLKPIDELELERTLQKITRRIGEKNLAQRLVQKNEMQKKKKSLRDLLHGTGTPAIGRKLLDECFREGAPVMLMSVALRHETIGAYTDASSLSGEQVAYAQACIERVATQYAPCLALEDDESTWLLILSTARNEDAAAVAEALRQFLREEWHSDARVCFSRAATAGELSALYEQVMQIEKYSQYLGDVQVLSSEDRSDELAYCQARFVEYGRQATEALRRHNPMTARRMLQEALDASMAINPKDLHNVYDLCYEIVLCAKGMLLETGAEAECAWLMGMQYGTIASLHTLEALRACMDRVLHMVSAPSAGKTDQYSQLVRDGIDFLNRHYDQNLSLEDVCNNLAISKNYFCYLFKRDTGVGLWAYLTDIRIRRAKALLRETSLRSLEIAFQVGYDNPSYFSKLFKKTVGMTPNEYRAHAREAE